MVMKNKSGFTLIELLTVIAIIAILAAIIFPVMGVAREAAKKTQCSANMSQLQTSLSLYKNDNNRYPPVLFGFVEYSGSAPLPVESIKHGYLFGEYTKNSAKVFSCPNNPIQAKDAAGGADIVVDPLAGNAIIGIDRPASMKFYRYDSYDSQVLNYDPTPLPRYTLAWADSINDVTAINSDIAKADIAMTFGRQLKFRNPPSDTVITWCSYHRGGSQKVGNGLDMVLYLDGHVARMKSDILYASTDPRYPYTVKPQ